MSETMVITKSGKTKHISLVQTYPLKSEFRAHKTNKLRAQYARSTKILTHFRFKGQDKLEFTSLTEQGKVGLWKIRGQEKEKEMLKLFSC